MKYNIILSLMMSLAIMAPLLVLVLFLAAVVVMLGA